MWNWAYKSLGLVLIFVALFKHNQTAFNTGLLWYILGELQELRVK